MKITSAVFLKSSERLEQCPNTGLPEFAFIGRSNVGKSSLINMLVNKKNLAKTSATPGKTRLINHFEIESDAGKWYLVDLPGYGYAKISRDARLKWEKMIQEYLNNRETLVCTVVLADVRLDPQQIDIDFCKKMGEDGLPFAIAFTKSDKEKPAVIERHVNAFCDKLLEYFQEMPNMFLTSAQSHLGKEKILGFIESGMQQNNG